MKFSARRPWFSVLGLLLACAVSVLHPRDAALAAGKALAPSVPAKMKDLNDQALADYQAGDYESAKLGLLESIAIGAKAGLSRDFLMVNSYVNLAAVYLNGLKDQAKAKKALGAALKIKSDLTLPDAVSTPELRALLAQLQGKSVDDIPAPAGSAKAPPVAAAPKPPAPKPAAPPAEAKPKETVAEAPPPPKSESREAGGDEPDLPASIPQPLYCPNPDEAPPGERIALRCVAQPGLSVARVLLYYRAVGDEKFASTPTNRSAKGWYNGVVPSEAASGKAVQYYFEARDASDEVAGSSGRSDSPNVILLREGAAIDVSADGRRAREEEDPLKEARRREEAAGHHRRRARSIFVGVSGGSGYGWQPGGYRLEYYKDAHISAGALPSGAAELVPEVGYQVADVFALSLQARFQWIPPTGTDKKRAGAPASGALAILARGEFFIGPGNYQGTISLYAGGGEGFRLTQQPVGNIVRNDTVLGGPGVGGAGVGFIAHLSPHFAITVDLRGLAGFPTFAVVGDGTAGVQVGF